MRARSSLEEVRNPMLRLPGVREAAEKLPMEARGFLRVVLLAFRVDCQENAQKCWVKHKAPMALYWKCLAVYSGHIARLLK